MKSSYRKTIVLFLAFCFLFGMCSPVFQVYAQEETGQAGAFNTGSINVYLPLVMRSSELVLMTGIYPVGWPNADTINNEMKPMDEWLTGVTGGKSTSIFGTFMTLDLTDAIAKANVEDPLTVIWNAGYAPFINLPALSGNTAYDVATSAKYGDLLAVWARSFAKYADNGRRFAYIAPLQEMNGEWVAYGKDPANFILAYKRFQTIFAEQGVPEESVKWVFAPNGWSRPGLPTFEDYYPGDANVDVVAISAYNFGYCNGGVWEEPNTVFNNPYISNGHYLDRLRAMAPSKPIFIAQTATSSYKVSGASNPSEKERWLKDAYSYLSTQKNVRAVIYFNSHKECDWEIFTNTMTSQIRNEGYKTGATSNGYQYMEPALLLKANYILK